MPTGFLLSSRFDESDSMSYWIYLYNNKKNIMCRGFLLPCNADSACTMQSGTCHPKYILVLERWESTPTDLGRTLCKCMYTSRFSTMDGMARCYEWVCHNTQRMYVM